MNFKFNIHPWICDNLNDSSKNGSLDDLSNKKLLDLKIKLYVNYINIMLRFKTCSTLFTSLETDKTIFPKQNRAS